jgi:hypothetical protein
VKCAGGNALEKQPANSKFINPVSHTFDQPFDHAILWRKNLTHMPSALVQGCCSRHYPWNIEPSQQVLVPFFLLYSSTPSWHETVFSVFVVLG